MIVYCTRTGTRSIQARLAAAGWRVLLTPDAATLPEVWGRNGYAIDNSAWGAFRQGRPWCPQAWQALVARHGADADWVVAPDIVAGGAQSLALSRAWLPWLRRQTPRVLLAVQDGMGAEDVRELLDEATGLFVGGSTAWKEATIAQWAALAHERMAHIHVARVNTKRRLARCVAAAVDSIDGTGVLMEAHQRRFDDWRRQRGLFEWARTRIRA